MAAREKQIILGFVLFFAAACLSLVNADDFSYGVKRIGKMTAFLGFIPMLLGARRLGLHLSRPFLLGILISGPVTLGVVLYKTKVLGHAIATAGYNYNVFGHLTMISALIGICALLTNVLGRRYAPAVFLAVVCSLCACLLSGSRGAWIEIPVVIPVILWLHRTALNKKNILAILIFFLIIGTGFSFIGGAVVEKRVLAAFHSMDQYLKGENKETAVGQRFEIWKVALDMWSANPLLGSGLGDFRHDAMRKTRQGDVVLMENFNQAHSIYFEFLGTTGLIGFLAMLTAVLVLPFRVFYQRLKNNASPDIRFPALAGMVCILAFALFGLTEGWMARSPLVKPYVVCLLVFMSGCGHRRESCHEPG